MGENWKNTDIYNFHKQPTSKIPFDKNIILSLHFTVLLKFSYTHSVFRVKMSSDSRMLDLLCKSSEQQKQMKLNSKTAYPQIAYD